MNYNKVSFKCSPTKNNVFFYDDMVSMSSDTGINKFFVRSRSHVMVTVLVASRYKDFFSFEKLCE